MRRQTALGRVIPADKGRAVRPDPLALPVRFAAPDAAADGRLREVEIDRDAVLLSRKLHGMSIRVRVSVRDFVGVAMRADDAGALTLSLEHRDANLSIELQAATDDDILADWNLWGRVLGLPLLVSDFSGNLVPAFPTLGSVRVGVPGPRRRRRNVVARRRGRFPLRRRSGRPVSVNVVYREAEIIARS